MKKVAIYARVSTDEQAEVREGGTKNQIEALKKYIEGENHKHDGTWGVLVDVYVDDGFSAKSLNRPALIRLLQDVAKKKVDIVLITEISRLSRTIKDWVHLREFLSGHSASFITSRQNFETYTANGRAMLDLAITFAQLEREQTAERVTASYYARTSRGLWGGGPVPYGLDLTDNPGYLELNSAKQIIATSIFDILLNDAGSLSKAVEIIGRAGYKREGGESWEEKSLARWIRSRALVGEVEQNKKNRDKNQAELREQDRYKVIKAVWEPVVDKDKWQRANELLDLNYQKLKVSQWQHYDYVLSGLMECQKGVSLVGGSGWGGSGKKNCSYRHKEKSKCDCGIKPVKAEDVEALVFGELQTLVESPEVMARLVSAANSEFEKDQPNYSAAVMGIKKRLEGVKRKTNAVLDELLEAPADEKRLWLEKKEALIAERSSLEAELQEIELRAKDQTFGKFDAEKMLDMLQTFGDGFDDLPIASRQAFLRAIVERIIVRPEEIEIIIKNPGFPIGGGSGGQKKSPVTAVIGCGSGDHLLAHSENWGT